MMIKKIAFSLFTLTSVYTAPLVLADMNSAFAAEASTQAAPQETVRVPAMRNRVYSQLARAQKIADEGDKAGGFAVLDEVKEQLSNLNSYEKAMLWNFYAFMHYANDELVKTTTYFKKVVDEKAIPQSLRLSTLYSLSQLSMQIQDYAQSLAYLKQWQALNSKDLSASQQILFAQIYYQLKDFEASKSYTSTTIEAAIALGKTPKENWLILQRANEYELKQPKAVTKTIEMLVKYYDKADYWVQLAAMYGEIQEEEKQLAVMESAWQAGYVTKPADIITLVQLYRYHGVPIKAANLLTKALKNDQVEENERHLEMLAQSYLAAKDDEKSIPVLIQAASIAKTGKFDAQLAQSYLNLEKWALAIKSANKALERGSLESDATMGTLYLVLGMANSNLQQFEESLEAFAKAQEFDASAPMAKQWYAYIEKEQFHQNRLVMNR